MISPLVIPMLGVLVALVAVFGGVIVKPWLAHREKLMEREAQILAARSAERSREQIRLEQRVAVLERILTDRSTQLGDEIERLRDTPLN